MTRWYYDDALAAAWMAERHGMKFEFGDLRYPEHAIRHRAYRREPIKTYVHPDSVALLEPAMGDLVRDEGWLINSDASSPMMPQLYQRISIAEYRDVVRARGHYEIIQRNGLAFHWPKREDA